MDTYYVMVINKVLESRLPELEKCDVVIHLTRGYKKVARARIVEEKARVRYEIAMDKVLSTREEYESLEEWANIYCEDFDPDAVVF